MLWRNKAGCDVKLSLARVHTQICFQTHSKTRREEGKQGSLAYIPKTEATSLATLERYSVTQMCINQDWVNSNKAVIIFEIH